MESRNNISKSVVLPDCFRLGSRHRSNPNKTIHWRNLDKSPGRLGVRREKKIAKLNKELGNSTWRFAWDNGKGEYLGFDGATKHFEKSFEKYLNRHPDMIQYLSDNASEVYDIEPSDVESGKNYYIQSPRATHIQDIAIRRIMSQQNLPFNGNRLIQIRGVKENPDDVGRALSPFNVPFYLPNIVRSDKSEPSTEDFWQKNRIIQVSDDLLSMSLEERLEYLVSASSD